MAKVSISEAARLTGKSRTTLHRLIKAGELSTCPGERNAKMLETSELLRVFGAFVPVSVEQAEEQVSGQRDTVTSDHNEQVIYILKQEIEHPSCLKRFTYRQPETGDVVAGEPGRETAEHDPAPCLVAFLAVLKFLTVFAVWPGVFPLWPGVFAVSVFVVQPSRWRFFVFLLLLLLPDGPARLYAALRQYTSGLPPFWLSVLAPVPEGWTIADSVS